MMRAAEVMTRGVLSVVPATPVVDAVHLMLDHRVSGLPVVDEAGQVIGIVTEGDLLRRVEIGTEPRRTGWQRFLLGRDRLADEYCHSHGRHVADVMTADVVVIAEETPLDVAVSLMTHRGIKRLPVLRAGKLVGILSRSDLLRALVAPAGVVEASTGEEAGRNEDAAIRSRVLVEMARAPFGAGNAVDVQLKGGVATLRGVVYSEAQRRALHVIVENAAGVVEVVDRLTWVEPYSGTIIDSPVDGAADDQTVP